MRHRILDKGCTVELDDTTPVDILRGGPRDLNSDVGAVDIQRDTISYRVGVDHSDGW